LKKLSAFDLDGTAIVLRSRELAEASQQTRKNFRELPARGHNRSIRMCLLSGFTMWVSSLYCQPEKGLAQRGKGLQRDCSLPHAKKT